MSCSLELFHDILPICCLHQLSISECVVCVFHYAIFLVCLVYVYVLSLPLLEEKQGFQNTQLT